MNDVAQQTNIGTTLKAACRYAMEKGHRFDRGPTYKGHGKVLSSVGQTARWYEGMGCAKFMRGLRKAGCALAPLVLPLGGHAAQPVADLPGATLPELLVWAEQHNPELAAMRHEADAAEARVQPAGALPDSTFSVEWRDIPSDGDFTLAPSRVGLAGLDAARRQETLIRTSLLPQAELTFQAALGSLGGHGGHDTTASPAATPPETPPAPAMPATSAAPASAYQGH